VNVYFVGGEIMYNHDRCRKGLQQCRMV